MGGVEALGEDADIPRGQVLDDPGAQAMHGIDIEDADHREDEERNGDLQEDFHGAALGS